MSQPRRTQAERSAQMRKRLLEATLSCLASEGYAGSTVSKIVERAQVSRGAPVHHYPSKAALIEAAAEFMIHRIYAELGRVVLSLPASPHHLEDIILGCWRSVFGKQENAAMLELMLASRHDEELALMMRRLWTVGYDTLKLATQHYFEPLQEDAQPLQLMTLTQWLLRGMSLDLHLVHDTAIFEHFIKLWVRLLATQMRPRQDIQGPPPRPAFWDTPLREIDVQQRR